MEEIAKKNIEKTSHSLLIKVFSNFVLIEVALPFELYSKIIMELGYGSWDAERYVISKFTQEVFSLEYQSKIFFEDCTSFYNKMKTLGHEIKDDNNNNWCKTVLLPINENNFESELERHITYIKRTSENFENSSDRGKAEFANKLLNKL